MSSGIASFFFAFSQLYLLFLDIHSYHLHPSILSKGFQKKDFGTAIFNVEDY